MKFGGFCFVFVFRIKGDGGVEDKVVEAKTGEREKSPKKPKLKSHTVLSGDVLVDTDPWGHPFPEYELSMMVICPGSGAVPDCGTGVPSAKAGRRATAAILESILDSIFLLVCFPGR